MAATATEQAARYAALRQLYEDAELVILERLARTLGSGKPAPDWALRKLNELSQLNRMVAGEVAKLNNAAAQHVIWLITAAYDGGKAEALRAAVAAGLPTPNVKPMVSEAVRRLAQEAAATVEQTGFTVLRTVLDAYRDTVSKTAGYTLSGSATQGEVVQRALDQLADKGITGFVDKAGRNWEMQAYVDMATRSAHHRATTQGHLDKLQSIGHNLVVVSDHKGECPKCRKWEGKVLRIQEGEEASEYPTVAQARSAGLEHPGCRHRYGIWIDGVSKPPEKQGKPEDYDAQQKQRALERGVRQWKRREAVALTPEAKLKARGRVRAWQGALRQHVADNDLQRNRGRERNLAGVAGRGLPEPRRS